MPWYAKNMLYYKIYMYELGDKKSVKNQQKFYNSEFGMFVNEKTILQWPSDVDVSIETFVLF